MKLQYYILHIDYNRYTIDPNIFLNILENYETIFAAQQGALCKALCEDSSYLKLHNNFIENVHFHHNCVVYITEIHEREEMLNLYEIVKNGGEVILDNNKKWMETKNSKTTKVCRNQTRPCFV